MATVLTDSSADILWKENWERTRERLTDWWERRGLVLCVLAPKDEPQEDLPEPEEPADIERAWLDPTYRARKAEFDLARTFFGGEAFPYFDTHIGPGNLALFLGSEPRFMQDTVWYEPCIDDPDRAPALRFDPQNTHFREQMAIVAEGLRISRGRFLVGMPDLIENVDTLASLRGAQALMLDIRLRPDFVKEKVGEINRAFFAAFDAIYQAIKDPWGGNAFSAFRVWGPGKTAKVQCDASAMLSPEMFAEFVVPALTEQCRWLGYAMFHLDGTQCMVHLDHLLAIEALQAIEWTPQAGMPSGGDPAWFDLYRKILTGGKSVQAVGVEPKDVIPLLDAVGSQGMFIITSAESETEARALVEQAERYR